MRSLQNANKNAGALKQQDLKTAAFDFKSAAAVAEFTADDRGLDTPGKLAPSRVGVKTVLGGESRINVDHRIRAAAVPIGADLGDDAFIVESLSVEGFTETPSILAKRLMPRRPAWSYELSGGRLHHREVQAFKQWLDDIRELIAERGGYPPAFEQNLQVWRQLWRVLERCDVAVLVVDARHPLLHMPPALVYHVAQTLHKPLVVVLNKLDTVGPQDAERWAVVLQEGLPAVAAVVGFSKESVNQTHFKNLKVGREALISECHRVYEETTARERAAGRRPVRPPPAAGADDEVAAAATEGRVMLGMVGHPNVGKSSLINNIMGGKVVSVKATPGHTKTLQTLFLDDRTCLCDTPGVVFPRLEVPREAQIVGMLIPLAQVREPYSALRWVMMHATRPLQELLGLKSPTLEQVMALRECGTEALALDSGVFEDDGPLPWSPMLLCALYARQRGLVDSGGPNCLKAGMEILERVLDGRVPYAVPPPDSFVDSSAQNWLPGAADSDNDSDWAVASDEGYESKEDNAEAADLLAKGDLLGFFGQQEHEPGGCTLGSRKRKARRKEKEKKETEKTQSSLEKSGASVDA